jgi:ferric-dicitrate binding protein FerR (iron transport regulator)
MSSNKQHINEEHRLPEEWEEVVGKTQPKFNKSKEAVWSEMMGQIDEQPRQPKVIQMNWFRYAAAAVLVLALTSVSFMRFSTQTITAPAGQHASALLPDGSQVELNAASEISFHPYWWRFSRDVNFEGEAFFDVKKGSSFSVMSKNGTTTVLGTSFNINSRDNGYQVYCKTGKVGVSNNNSKVVLEPQQVARLNAEGSLDRTNVSSDDEFIGWINNRFVFNAAPFEKVVREIELQYDISISLSKADFSTLSFTGTFAKTEDEKQTLEIVGNSLGVEFEQTAIGAYSVKKN